MIKDAHDALLDIQSSGRSKELLAQGLMASKDRSQEQEKLERRRLVRRGWGWGGGVLKVQCEGNCMHVEGGRIDRVRESSYLV